MAKVQAWSPEKFKSELSRRLKYAKKYRQHFEEDWRKNERTVVYWNSRSPHEVVLTDDLMSLEMSENVPEGAPEMSVNFAWKFLRFLHSQLSANPPSVIARPASTDTSDRAKADAADRICRHAYSDKDMQEVFDQANLKALTYGTGWVRVLWDPDAGDTFEFDEASGDLTMTGDIRVYSPSTWDVWIDPDAKTWAEVRYVFERVEMPKAEAIFLFGQEYADKLERVSKGKSAFDSELDSWREPEDVVEVFYYTEKALPINGMAGRQAVCLEDGTLLAPPSKNKNPGEVLGYAQLADVDVADQVYGASFITYIRPLQDLLNRLDTAIVDAVAAHGVVRFIIPDGCEVEEEFGNSNWDYLKITGAAGNEPHFVNAPQLMPDIHRLRESLVAGIQEMAGVNDAMFGKTSREVSALSMQTMISAGSEIRRRLFNRYTLAVRDVFRMYLACAREYWNEPRTIMVIGKERSFEAADFKGSDINGGYDLVVEYGASLSLDPARRREEIIQLMPHLKEAGVDAKKVLRHIRLNELENIYDRLEVAAQRQKEYFDEMLAKGSYIPPREIQDHAAMLEYAYEYVMGAEFKYLREEEKELIEQHIREREQLAAKTAVNGQAPPQGGPAPAGAPAVPGVPAPGPTGTPAAAPPPAPVAPPAA